jgi:hypothetical protein
MSTPILALRPLEQAAKINSRTDSAVYINGNYQAWVSVASARAPGLFMASNMFKSFDRNYGGFDSDGSIGYNWEGGVVGGGSSTGYRPSPMVTSLEVEEGIDNTLTRRANFTIVAHSGGQAKELIKYFLEPGYTIFLQWGWATAGGQAIGPKLGGKDVAGYQWPSGASDKRKASGWEYDNYVGMVVGGNIEQDGDKWNINVKCNGLSELTLYKPGSSTAYDNEAESDVQTVTYTPAEIEKARGNSVDLTRFMLFFNELPSNRRTENVRVAIKSSFLNWRFFVNFDPTVVATLNDKTSFSFLKTLGVNFSKYFGAGALLGGGAGAAAAVAGGLWKTVQNWWSGTATTTTEGENVELESGTELASTKDRYIRFAQAIEILNQIDTDGYVLKNGDTLSYRVDISGVCISAFPKIFSTKRANLFIPNKNSPAISLKYAIKNTSEQTQFTGTKDNSIGGIEFPKQTALGGYVPKGADGSSAITRAGGTWGKLEDLYINFDFFKGIIEKPNVPIKEMLYQMLNGMSDAAGGIWDFQIYQTKIGGKVVITVEDTNLLSNGAVQKPAVFDISGKDSPFISTTFNMDMSGKMLNKVVSERLGKKTDTTGTTVKDAVGTKAEDLVVTGMNITPKAVPKKTTNPTEGIKEEEVEQKKAENLARFLEKAAIVPKPKFNKTQVEKETDFDKCIIIAAYDDMALFESLKMGSENTKIDKSPTQVGVLTNIEFGFTIHGISGIRRGDMFKINGSPYGYVSDGFFQVTNIKHSVSNNFWQTEVKGGFRATRGI